MLYKEEPKIVFASTCNPSFKNSVLKERHRCSAEN